MPITDTSQPIKEEIESGIDMYTMYTVTVTVFTDFGNLSSNATFGKSFSLAHSIIFFYKIASIILVAMTNAFVTLLCTKVHWNINLCSQ